MKPEPTRSVPDPDRAHEWQINKAVEHLVGNGGICIWMLNDDLLGRGHVRFGANDPAVAATRLGALLLAADRLIDAAAARAGMPPATFREMIEMAKTHLAGCTEHCARTKAAPRAEKENG